MRLSFRNGRRDRLEGFPALVVLDPSRFDDVAAGTGSADLRFHDDDDDRTVLPHEVERWQEGGRSFLWVRVPRIDEEGESDHIWLYSGGPADGAAATERPVFDEDLVGVWHLEGGAKDASVHENVHVETNGAAQAEDDANAPVGLWFPGGGLRRGDHRGVRERDPR